LILLDLQLPKRSGLEVLAEINKDEGLRHIPVVVLTGTSAEGSMLQSYGISPSRFMRKPVNVARFDVTMTTLRSYSQREAEQSPEVSVAESPAAPMGRWWWPFG
jgi:CheY-like chemotaxis protein